MATPMSSVLSEAGPSTSRKRSFGEPDDVDEEVLGDSAAAKRQRGIRLRYFYTLASESSVHSDDTESVLSIQDHETDVVADTPDTESNASSSDLTDIVEYNPVEYYPVSSEYQESSNEPKFVDYQSSGSENRLMTVGRPIAAALCNSSDLLDVTDHEDDSDQSDFKWGRGVYNICVACKEWNRRPAYRFCRGCYQKRKLLYPPRPRGRKKRRIVKTSQDSGVALIESGDSKKVSFETNLLTESNNEEGTGTASQLIDSKVDDSSVPNQMENITKTVGTQTDLLASGKDLCVTCNEVEVNSVFMHGSSGHACCCYKCAMKTWQTCKFCPICRRKIVKIVKVFVNTQFV